MNMNSTCPKCNKTFKRPRALNTHLRKTENKGKPSDLNLIQRTIYRYLQNLPSQHAPISQIQKQLGLHKKPKLRTHLQKTIEKGYIERYFNKDKKRTEYRIKENSL